MTKHPVREGFTSPTVVLSSIFVDFMTFVAILRKGTAKFCFHEIHFLFSGPIRWGMY